MAAPFSNGGDHQEQQHHSHPHHQQAGMVKRELGGVAECEGCVQMDVVARMRWAVEGNREVQVEVVNYKKSGEAFVNFLSIVPLGVPGWAGGGDGGGFTLSVGFLCDVASVVGG